MTKISLFASVAAVALSISAANAQSPTTSATASLNIDSAIERVASLGVNVLSQLNWGTVRYSGSGTYGWSAVTLADAGSSYTCTGTVQSGGSVNIEQRGTPVPGLVQLSGEANRNVRITLTDTNGSENNILKLNNGAQTLDVQNFSMAFLGGDPVAVEATPFEGNVVTATAGDGTVGLCFFGEIVLPDAPVFGTYISDVNIAVVYP